MKGNFSDNSEKGRTLMIDALKKLGEGDIEGFDKTYEQAKRYLDKALVEYGKDADNYMYSESRNFGIAFNVFEQNIDTLFESEEGKKIIKEGYELIKKNEVLRNQFRVYDLFENASKNSEIKDVNAFVNEGIGLVKTYSPKELKENNQKFINFMRKNKLNEYVEIPEELEDLYESIEYVLLHKKNFNNLNEYVNATHTISEYIKTKSVLNENKTEKKMTFEDFETKLNSIQEQTDKELNDEEVKVLESFVSDKVNKKKLFEEEKRNLLKLINETIETAEEGEKQQWYGIYEKIEKKNYQGKLVEDITNYAEMLEISNEIRNED